MRPLRIAVCVKPVPDPAYYDKITVDPLTKRLQRNGAPSVINELDRYALIKGVELKKQTGGELLIFSMAPPESRFALLEALSFGADRLILLSDRAFGGADTLATAYTLAEGIRKYGPFDLVLTGNESSDGGTNQVSAQLGEMLGMFHLLNVKSLGLTEEGFRITALTDSGVNTYEASCPLLCGVTHSVAAQRLPHLRDVKRALSLPFEIVDASSLGAEPQSIGDNGSPTKAGGVYEKPKGKEARSISGTPQEIVDALIDEIRKIGLCQ